MAIEISSEIVKNTSAKMHMAEERRSDREARRRWMATLARCSVDELQALLHDKLPLLDYQVPRPPEIGLCMVRGRIGGSGRPFNLGEMTLTRCVVQLDEQTAGVAYVRGRDKPKAELAAVADALLQAGSLALADVEELHCRQQQLRQQREQAVSATRVDFFTLARGED